MSERQLCRGCWGLGCLACGASGFRDADQQVGPTARQTIQVDASRLVSDLESARRRARQIDMIPVKLFRVTGVQCSDWIDPPLRGRLIDGLFGVEIAHDCELRAFVVSAAGSAYLWMGEVRPSFVDSTLVRFAGDAAFATPDGGRADLVVGAPSGDGWFDFIGSGPPPFDVRGPQNWHARASR